MIELRPPLQSTVGVSGPISGVSPLRPAFPPELVQSEARSPEARKAEARRPWTRRGRGRMAGISERGPRIPPARDARVPRSGSRRVPVDPFDPRRTQGPVSNPRPDENQAAACEAPDGELVRLLAVFAKAIF